MAKDWSLSKVAALHKQLSHVDVEGSNAVSIGDGVARLRGDVGRELRRWPRL